MKPETNLPALIPYRKNTKWGFVDSRKNTVIDFTYDEAGPFCDGMAPVMRKNGDRELWGYINENGTEILPCSALRASQASEGIGEFCQSPGDISFITAQGNIIARGYAGCSDASFSEGLCAVMKNDKWGFIDKTGREVIPCTHDWDGRYAAFHEGLACVSLNRQDGFIDTSGTLVIPAIYRTATRFSGGLAAVETDKGWQFINSSGKVVIKGPFETANAFSEGLAAVQDKRAEKWGYVDKTGRLAIPFIYDEVYDFSDGLARVETDDGMCHIDSKGKQRTKDYYITMDFSEGLASVTVSGNGWGFINHDDELVIPEKYESASALFHNGICRVKFLLKKKEYHGYIDRLGNEYWEIDTPKKAKPAKAAPDTHFDISTYERLTEEVDVEKADKKYKISKQVFIPFLDNTDSQQTRLHKGDLHVASLKMSDDTFNLIVDGDLIVDKCLIGDSGDFGNFIFVTGNIRAGSIIVCGVCTLAAKGSVTAANGIAGYSGFNGGSIDVAGETTTPFILAESDLNMSFGTVPHAKAVFAGTAEIFIKSTGKRFSSEHLENFIPKVMKEGEPDTDAIIGVLMEGGHVIRPA